MTNTTHETSALPVAEPGISTTWNSRYGVWEGIHFLQTTPDGVVESFHLERPNHLRLPFGLVTPLWDVEDHGRRRQTPVLFYPDGTLKSLPLQERTAISTTAGELPAELLTFYKTGELRRIFPSAGKLSGFWTEENEYQEAPVCELSVGGMQLRAKMIAIQLYTTGAVRSITLWPGEKVTVTTPLGTMSVRIGLSFYPDGRLESVEPAAPTLVPTAIGMVSAFDNDPLGIHADRNSLQFDRSGQVSSLRTVSSAIKVFPCDREAALHAPVKQQSFCEETDTTWKTLGIDIAQDQVRFTQLGSPAASYPLATTQFEVVVHKGYSAASCGCGG